MPGFDDMDNIYASPGDFQSMRKRNKARGLHLLEYFVGRCHEVGVPCEAWIKKGAPKEVICHEVKRVQPDPLVVGSRGLGPFQRKCLARMLLKMNKSVKMKTGGPGRRKLPLVSENKITLSRIPPNAVESFFILRVSKQLDLPSEKVNKWFKNARVAEQIKKQLEDGQYEDATNSWSELESVISINSNFVAFNKRMPPEAVDLVSRLL